MAKDVWGTKNNEQEFRFTFSPTTMPIHLSSDGNRSYSPEGSLSIKFTYVTHTHNFLNNVVFF